ncbi:MAG: porin [Kiritimatiellia bacterium]
MKHAYFGLAMVGTALALPLSAAAEIKLAGTKPNSEIRIWGQVNRAALYADNGYYSEWFHVDNDSMPSRIGMAADYKPPEWADWTFGGQIELGFKSDNSCEVKFESEDPEFKVDGRKIEAWAKNPRFGSLSVGQGDMASNGTAEEDLSGTYVISYSQVRFMAGSLIFGHETNSPAIKDVFNNFDGLHRDDRIRYDTPSWKGFTMSASAGGHDFYDAAIRHKADIGEHKIASAISFAQKDTAIDQYCGSVSILLKCGLNLTAAAGGQDIEGDYSPLSFYGKIGWKLDLFSCGLTCVAVDYSQNAEISRADDTAESYAVVLNQRVEPILSDLYVSVRNYTLDRDGKNYDDILTFMSGIKLAF